MDIEITFCLPYVLIGIILAGILVLDQEYEILDAEDYVWILFTDNLKPLSY